MLTKMTHSLASGLPRKASRTKSYRELSKLEFSYKTDLLMLLFPCTLIVLIRHGKSNAKTYIFRLIGTLEICPWRNREWGLHLQFKGAAGSRKVRSVLSGPAQSDSHHGHKCPAQAQILFNHLKSSDASQVNKGTTTAATKTVRVKLVILRWSRTFSAAANKEPNCVK